MRVFRDHLCSLYPLPSCFLKVSVFFAALALTGCASTSDSTPYAGLATTGKFNTKYGVKTSPRVIADGEAAPKGGGNYMVGKPYKIAGKTYYPSEQPYSAVGTASWYGSDFHGRRTANGEVFDRTSITAAHPTMPLPSYARVTNLKNDRSIIVRVNDRGPYHGGRVMDVSQRTAEALDFKAAGTAKVKVEWIGKADLGGDDDARLLATLRENDPARLDGDEPVMTALRDVAPSRVAAAALESESAPLAYAGPDTTAETSAMPTAATVDGAEAAGTAR